MYCCPKEIFSLGDQTKAKKKKKKYYFLEKQKWSTPLGKLNIAYHNHSCYAGKL